MWVRSESGSVIAANAAPLAARTHVDDGKDECPPTREEPEADAVVERRVAQLIVALVVVLCPRGGWMSALPVASRSAARSTHAVVVVDQYRGNDGHDERDEYQDGEGDGVAAADVRGEVNHV